MDEDDLEELWRDCETRPKQVYQGQTRDGWRWWWWCRKDIGRECILCKEWSKRFCTVNVVPSSRFVYGVYAQILRVNHSIHMCWEETLG